MLDLYHARRDDLIGLILALQDQIADLAQQVARQETELATADRDCPFDGPGG